VIQYTQLVSGLKYGPSIFRIVVVVVVAFIAHNHQRTGSCELRPAEAGVAKRVGDPCYLKDA
jgi:hypothetical protein